MRYSTSGRNSFNDNKMRNTINVGGGMVTSRARLNSDNFDTPKGDDSN